MAFKKWITGIFWWKKTSELEKLIEKQQEIIKELGESSKEAVVPSKKQEETIEKFKNDIREISNILEKERERASSLEREIRKQQRISDELKDEVERKTSLISEYDGKLDEVSNRYPEVIEKLEVWKSMYPFFCNQALSTPNVAVESLKILDVLIDYSIVGDYKNLQKVLLHKSDEVAYLALDVLRKIKGLTEETRIEGVKPVSAEISAKSMEKAPQKIQQQIEETEHLMQILTK